MMHTTPKLTQLMYEKLGEDADYADLELYVEARSKIFGGSIEIRILLRNQKGIALTESEWMEIDKLTTLTIRPLAELATFELSPA